MSTSEKTETVPSYDFVQSIVPPTGPAQANTMTATLQWNMNPVPNGPNEYPGAIVWNVSSPPPQIIFQNGNQQWSIQPLPPPYVEPPASPQDTRLANLHNTFLKGKPYALGIVLIVTAIIEIAFAISVPFLVPSVTIFSGIPFWGSLFYIIAGSLSISSHKKPSVCKVKSALTLNIVSSITSMITIILSILDFSIIDCEEFNSNCSDEHGSSGFTVLSFILVMNLLVFCVSVSLSAFGCQAVKEEKAPTNVPAAFVIQNDDIVLMPPSTVTTEDLNKQPPPYVFEEEEPEKKEKPEN